MEHKTGPRLTRRMNRRYHCDEVPELHDWLEAQGYTFYGPHDTGEYGRFSLQEAHKHGEHQSYVHRFIQVFENGDVYSPDPDACLLLDELIDEKNG